MLDDVMFVIYSCLFFERIYVKGETSVMKILKFQNFVRITYYKNFNQRKSVMSGKVGSFSLPFLYKNISNLRGMIIMFLYKQ